MVFDYTKIVTFAEKGIEEEVREAINKPEGVLYKTDVEEITEFIYDGYIKDVSGIEHLSNLRILTFSHTVEITDISALRMLKNLKNLYLVNTRISDVDKQSLRDALPKCNIRFDLI